MVSRNEPKSSGFESRAPTEYQHADGIEITTGHRIARAIEGYGPQASGEWQFCTLHNGGRFLSIEQNDLIKSGMSGSPIIDSNGVAIGLSRPARRPQHESQPIRLPAAIVAAQKGCFLDARFRQPPQRIFAYPPRCSTITASPGVADGLHESTVNPPLVTDIKMTS